TSRPSHGSHGRSRRARCSWSPLAGMREGRSLCCAGRCAARPRRSPSPSPTSRRRPPLASASWPAGQSFLSAEEADVVFPVIIFAAVAVPLLVIGFLAMRRSKEAGEHPATETDAERRRTEHEFEEAERYQEQWREEHKADRDHL